MSKCLSVLVFTFVFLFGYHAKAEPIEISIGPTDVAPEINSPVNLEGGKYGSICSCFAGDRQLSVNDRFGTRPPAERDYKFIIFHEKGIIVNGEACLGYIFSSNVHEGKLTDCKSGYIPAR